MYYGAVEDDDSSWAPVSDLMAVLMLVFMFIAVISIRTIVNEEEILNAECDEIYQALKAEFEGDFLDWKVVLLRDSTIRFRDPDVLFEAGSHEIRSDFRVILSLFFPRYLESINEFREDIREIRIEGHTSSEFKNSEKPYISNMRLSQDRTREILEYVLSLPDPNRYVEWAKPLITANGLSSSRLIRNKKDEEDKILSRRVEFRLLASSCQKAGIYDNQN